MSSIATEDAGGGGGDGGEEYKIVYRGKGLTEKELQDRKQDEEQKMSSKASARNTKRRDARKDSRAVKSVDRFNPYGSASRKLIQSNPNETLAARSRSSSSDAAGSSTSSLHSFADAAAGSTPVPFLGTPIPAVQATESRELTVTRADGKSLSRDDIFVLQAEIGTAEISILESSGMNPHDIIQAKRDSFGRAYILTCNSSEAILFYKQALESCDSLSKDHPGFKCYKPGERPPGHRITGKLYMHGRI